MLMEILFLQNEHMLIIVHALLYLWMLWASMTLHILISQCYHRKYTLAYKKRRTIIITHWYIVMWHM